MNRNDFNGELEDKLNDTSLYGEFIATFHYWVSSEEQKNKVQYLQSIGKAEAGKQ